MSDHFLDPRCEKEVCSYGYMQRLRASRCLGLPVGGGRLMTTSCMLAQRAANTVHHPPAGTREDHRSGASVVVLDENQALEVRNRQVRALLKSSTTAETTVIVERGIAHTVPYTLKVVLDTQNHKEISAARAKSNEIIKAAFAEADQILNHFNPNSEVSVVNGLPLGAKHKMSPTMVKVVACAVEVHRITGGCFDPGCLPIVKYLRAHPHELVASGGLSDAGRDIASISTLYDGFNIDIAAHTIEKRDARAALDFGALIKGFGVDSVVEQLVQAGFHNCFFDWGGDCRGAGCNNLGKPWVVGVACPPSIETIMDQSSDQEQWRGDSNPMLRACFLDNEGFATSGDYENLLRVDDPAGGPQRLFCSTMDWRANRLIEPSAEAVAQVSVKCQSAMYADALSTAAFTKRQFSRIRVTLEEWRNTPVAVSDYVAFARQGSRVAHMHETSKESVEMRNNRIRGSFPARVVVVGGGLAGLAAAIEVAECGASVVILEKASQLGGNSAKATSGINGWGTRAQALQKVRDGGIYFERDTYLSGLGGTCNAGLVKMFSVKSGEAIRWLSSFGIPLTVLSQLGGHSRKRCHRAPDMADGTPVPIGYTIMKTLEAHIRTNLSRQVHIITDCCVKGLSYETTQLPDGTASVSVSGVTYELAKPQSPESWQVQPNDDGPVALSADAVILTTGGFSNDQSPTSLMREFAPHLFGRPTTNGAFATGDGVKMARALGAQLVDMDAVQLHPTGFVDPSDPTNSTKFLGPEALRGSGGILLNKQGERFVNELDLRSVVSKAINEQKNEYPNSNGMCVAYCVLNAAAAKLFGMHALEYYWKKQRLFTFAEDVAALADVIGCPLAALEATLTAYAQDSGSKVVCQRTGKKVYPAVIGTEGPFYVAVITPSIHYTMGGCLISPSAEIQSTHLTTSIFKHHRQVQGLFGAGEVTGGVHGRNRLGGNSLLECVVFGRIAGDRAATILQKRPNALDPMEWTTVVLREVREGAEYGSGSKVLLFNLPGALQCTGLQLGQFVSVRGDWDGQSLVGYYSPITLPDDRGVIGILVRSDKGPLKDWLNALSPGDAIEMKACGGLVLTRDPANATIAIQGRVVRKIALIAGGSGVAPMLQILQAAMERPYCNAMLHLSLVYAAEDLSELSYRHAIEEYVSKHPQVNVHYVLQKPPPGWIGGVGYVDAEIVQVSLPRPSDDLLVVICGPPAMQRSVVRTLHDLNYKPASVHTVDEGWQAA